MPETLQSKMESLLDAYGLTEMINALITVCYDKADHVRTNWQDENMGKAWDYTARQLDKVDTEACPL